MAEAAPSPVDFLRQRYTNDLYALCEEICGYEDMFPPLHRKIANFITDWKPGKFIKLLLVPRKHLKSSIGSVANPLNIWLRDRDAKILLAHGVMEQGKGYVKETKGYLENPVLHEIAPDTFYESPKESNLWQQEKIDICCKWNKVPSLTLTSENASTTGYHYEYIICDDLVHSDNWRTPESRQKTKDYFKHLIPQRRPDAKILVLGTRWHFDDLYAMLLDPAFEDSNAVDSLVMDCGYPGEPIFPLSRRGKAGFTKESLEAERRAINDPFIWSCQYMNNPLPSESKRFDRQNVHLFDLREDGKVPFNGPIFYFTAVDPNRSLKTKNDPCVVMTVGRDHRGFMWVVDVARGHPNGPQLVQWIHAQVLRWAPQTVFIESTAYQNMIGSWCEADMQESGIYYSISMVDRGPTSKIERVEGMEVAVRRGGLWVRQGQPWTNALLDELEFYGQWKNDDMADALSDVFNHGWNPMPPGKKALSDRALKDEVAFNLSMRNGGVRRIGGGSRIWRGSGW